MVQLTNRVNRPGAVRRLPAARFLVGALLLAGAEAIVIARWWTGTGYQPAPLGLADAGAFNAVGLPIAQFVHEMAGVAVVGLLFVRCAALSRPITPAHRHLAAMAARWAWVWVGSTLAWIVLTMSDLIGLPISELLGHTDVVLIVLGNNRILAEMATLWVALAVALFGNRLNGIAGTAVALMVATAALLPSAVTGHAGHHDSPVLAAVTLGVHVTAAGLWVGGLLALIVHLRTFPDQLRTAVPRFSAVALGCVIAVGLSGVLESAIMLGSWDTLWGTNRGQLMLAKAIALGLLVTIGFWHRKRTVPAAVEGRLLPLLRLAAGELVVMGVTIGLAVALSTTP